MPEPGAAAEAGWEPLSEDVRRTLEILLDGEAGDAPGYRAQIPHTRMKAGCTCGCPSQYLLVGPGGVPAAGAEPAPIVASRCLRSPDGGYVGEALLFADEGLMVSLEVCHWEDLGPLVPPLWQRLDPV
ncbi:hypothetical protein [Streptomyces sp. W1SF4]|uniref:hypothetical protein n=1 Tax=Streptomyces sp. W1SF4 TaxID=2305220 RepID=UPI000F6FC329|nr:hypothetical protein [Streptomyces sp. W1SF4]AZM89751.1 hypothetical protein D1J60_15835 [Streptomyces sp. W1SF4]